MSQSRLNYISNKPTIIYTVCSARSITKTYVCSISIQCYMMKYCNLYCHNNKRNQRIQNISRSSTNGAAHTRVINTNEADGRCAAPHGKISLPHLSVRRYILSVCCCADCRWTRGYALILFFCSEHPSQLWTVAGYHRNCKSRLLSRFSPVTHCLPSSRSA